MPNGYGWRDARGEDKSVNVSCCFHLERGPAVFTWSAVLAAFEREVRRSITCTCPVILTPHTNNR